MVPVIVVQRSAGMFVEDWAIVVWSELSVRLKEDLISEGQYYSSVHQAVAVVLSFVVDAAVEIDLDG